MKEEGIRKGEIGKDQERRRGKAKLEGLMGRRKGSRVVGRVTGKVGIRNEEGLRRRITR